MNCSFHDEGHHNQCRESQSEYISDREGANFCDWFKLADSESKNSQTGSGDDVRKKFDELFRK